MTLNCDLTHDLWPFIFKVKFWKCCNSGMGCLIHMKRKGCESIESWTHVVTFNFDLTHDLDPWFSRSNFGIYNQRAINHSNCVWFAGVATLIGSHLKREPTASPVLTKWSMWEQSFATNFGSPLQMVTKVGSRILATKFGFVPDCCGSEQRLFKWTHAQMLRIFGRKLAWL